jgi:hypothetical protein
LALNWISTIHDPLVVEEVVITSNNQTEIPLVNSYVIGTNMIDIYLNGSLVSKDDYIEDTPNSILYSGGPLAIGDVITVRHHLSDGITVGDLRVVATYGELLALPDVRFNSIAVVTELKKFYHYGNNGWVEWNIPFTTKNIGLFFKYEKQLIEDTTQLTYTLEDISYNPGTNDLLVFINGLLVKEYIEVDAITITFDYDELPEGEIEFLVADTDPWEDTHNHSVEYSYDSLQNVQQEVLRYEGQAIRTTHYDYDVNGNISKETVIKNQKQIEKTYTYNSLGDIINIDIVVTSL